MADRTDTMEKIVALCRRRGFIFGSSEIYGGIGGFWDYGPLGTELKRNIKDAWWNDMVRNPPPGPSGIEFQMVGVDCAIIMSPRVWVASGHASGFADPMVDCKQCKSRFRSDAIRKTYIVPVADVTSADAMTIHLHDLALDQWRRNPECLTTTPWVHTSGDENAADRLAKFRSALGDKRAKIHDLSLNVPEQSYSARVVACESNNKCFILVDLASGEVYEGDPCPKCGGELTAPRQFNLMFKTHVGALEDASALAYLRPETAQGIFANFKNVIDTTRVKVPFGIAQVGKSFRNEINPRNYTFRSREFEQYEIEFFCHESEAAMWYEFWRDVRYRWYVGLGLRSEKLRLREHEGSELAHYARSCADVEYDFPFGLSELEGIANRTDFDLNAHQKHSGKDLSYFDDQRQERFVPYVIEPSGGVDRSVLAIITEAYTFDESRASPEFMKFHPRLAPIKAAVFPLVAKDGMPEIAQPIYREIKKHYPCQYDAKQSIGKRYARMDEAGTPFCFTIDGQSKTDGTVTVRDRDDASQIRIDKTRCAEYLHDKLRL